MVDQIGLRRRRPVFCVTNECVSRLETALVGALLVQSLRRERSAILFRILIRFDHDWRELFSRRLWRFEFFLLV